MQVRIGHATNTIINTDPAAGGPKVYTRPWYLHRKGWVLLRCMDADRREKIAEAMEKACANPAIGYDSHRERRGSLFRHVRTRGFDPTETTEAVSTDCSSLVRLCIAYACGADMTGPLRTRYLPAVLADTGLFRFYDDPWLCASPDHLMRGDILCTPEKGHTVVVLDNGSAVETSRIASEPARSYASGLAGRYLTTGRVNVRRGAGMKPNCYGPDKAVLIKLPKGTAVWCCGSYTRVGERKWLYIHFARDGVTYTGFASERYLTKRQA